MQPGRDRSVNRAPGHAAVATDRVERALDRRTRPVSVQRVRDAAVLRRVHPHADVHQRPQVCLDKASVQRSPDPETNPRPDRCRVDMGDTNRVPDNPRVEPRLL